MKKRYVCVCGIGGHDRRNTLCKWRPEAEAEAEKQESLTDYIRNLLEMAKAYGRRNL